MRLPVWIAAWEIQCCQPDITVGEEWTAWPMLNGDISWVDRMPDPLSESGRPIGVLEEEVEPVPGPTRDAPLARFLGITVGTREEFQAASRARFTLVHDAHWMGPRGPWSDIPDEYPPDVTGVVVGLWGVKYEWSHGIARAESEVRRILSTALPGEQQFLTYDRGFDSFLALIEIGVD